ncbi:MAG: BON domain-containing protein [Polyangia bacterium]
MTTRHSLRFLGGCFAATLVFGGLAFADKLPADNTGKNDPNRSHEGKKPTADQSKNDKSDIDITAQIRRSVMADKDLSMSAHNVKIIVASGVVTLKGPVKSVAEKNIIEKKAVEVAGPKNVTNQIEIAP